MLPLKFWITIWEIQYELWPRVRRWLAFHYWIIRYGGEKKIPREALFRALAKSVERMNKNLRDASRAMPLEDVNEEERLSMRDLLMKSNDLRQGIKNFKEIND